jgi:Protein of unknown function (DUF1449)
MTMSSFIDAAFSYPTALYTVLLGVVMVYWLMAMLGMVDFESSGIDIDIDVHADGDAGDIGTLAGYVVAFGLNGVPFSIVVSLLVLIGWTICCSLSMWLLPWVPTSILQWVAGTVLLVLSLGASLPLAAQVVRPMRRLFVSHTAIVNASLVGQTCKVLTQRVDDKVGRAEVAQRGASINIRVWADAPNQLKKGSVARIVEYDEAAARYLIQAET